MLEPLIILSMLIIASAGAAVGHSSKPKKIPKIVVSIQVFSIDDSEP
jgi:hypothetical protein